MQLFPTFQFFGICRRYHERKRRSNKSDQENTENAIPGKRSGPSIPTDHHAPPKRRLRTQHITKRNKVKSPIKLLELPTQIFRESLDANRAILAPGIWSDLHNVSPIQKLPCASGEQLSQSRFDLETSSVMVNIKSNRRLRRAVPPKRLSYQYSDVYNSSAIEANESPSTSVISDNDADDEIGANNSQNIQTSSTKESFGPVSTQNFSQIGNGEGQTVQLCETHSSQSADSHSSQSRSSRVKRQVRRKARTTDETVDKCVNGSSNSEQQASIAGDLSTKEPNSIRAGDHTQKFDISNLPNEAQRRSDKSSDLAKPKRTVQFHESHSTRTTRATRSKRSAENLQPEKRTTRSTVSQRDKSRMSNETVNELVQQISNFECQSVSETSTAPSISPNAIQNKSSPKRSTRPKVGFESNESKRDESSKRSRKFCLKGGKWRQTIFALRKSRSTTCK